MGSIFFTSSLPSGLKKTGGLIDKFLVGFIYQSA